MKIRIGVGLGASTADSDAFLETVQHLEACRFDSLWLSEVLTTGVLDPLGGLAFAAGVTRKLKLGTTMTVTGRNPVRLAKELATIDRLSRGRLLLVFVPGLTGALEDQALGVAVKERGAWIDEVLPLVRRLWSSGPVNHHGALFCYEGLTVEPKPLQIRSRYGSAARHRVPCAVRDDWRRAGYPASSCRPKPLPGGRPSKP